MSYNAEILAEENGGHKNLGWGRLLANFVNPSIKIILHRDASFYGKVPDDRYSEGFIFDHLNCSQEILEMMSEQFFEVRRDPVKYGTINLNAAVLRSMSDHGVYINESYVPKHSRRLLKSGDRIQIAPRLTMFTFFDDRDFYTKDVPNAIIEQFHLGKFIGRGGQSTVRLIHRFSTSEKFAMKILSKERRATESDYQFSKRIQHMKAEVDAMRELNHQNIIQLVEVKQGRKELFIIMELGEYGSLFEYMNKQPGKYFEEEEAKYCLFQICQGVSAIHMKNIAHRDLKLENIFVKFSIKGLIMKIGDFGYAKAADDHLLTQLGTFHFMPPEILEKSGKYSIKADIWSLGCVFYAALSGSFPFHDDYGGSVRDQIKTATLSFEYHRQWESVTEDAKRCIKRMIQMTPEKRPAIGDILKFSWFNDDMRLKKRVKFLYGTLDESKKNFGIEPVFKKLRINGPGNAAKR